MSLSCKHVVLLTFIFQCYTHRHLGWKINVLDECDEVEGEESRVIEKITLPDDLQSEESIQVHTRASPDNVIDPRKKVGKIINTKTNYDNFSSISGLTGEVFNQDRNQLYAKEQEFELPMSNIHIKEVIQTVEDIESKLKDEIKRNTSTMKPLGQYQVHEDVKESFTQEQPVREDDEYTVETAKVPESYFLPPNQKPLTLQTVLRPNGPKPSGNMRPPFRRPVPPEIKLRRPPPMFQKNNGYPLPMPNHQNHHGPHTMQKKPQKYPNNRLPPNMNMNRPHMGNSPPMKPMPPLHSKPQFNQGSQKYHGPKLSGPVQSIILGKPIPGNIQMPLPTKSQTLSLGQTDMIANQIVKSQITLPGAITTTGQNSFDTISQHGFDTIIQHSFDSIGQHNSPQTYQKPGHGQIILGKPMDNPIPLDQQMIQNKPQIIKTPPPPQNNPSTTLRIKLSNEHQQYNEIKSSDFIGESQESSTLHPAINTGFKPDSIVVESGFKPIIREPLMAGVDRIADGYETNSNRREDTDVEEDYEESPQNIVTNHAFSSDQITQSFEPMFIPSPEDHMLPTIPTNDKTKEVFPKNHAKEDRPHPIYVKTESELNALFSKKNMEKEVPDMMMESDRVSPHYLPPDPKLPKEHSQKLSNEPTFTTYDGKTVSAATLISIPDVNKTMNKLFSSKLPANTALLLRTPQFGPFKGEIPPPVDDSIAKDSAKLPDTRTTKLKLVNFNMPDKIDLDDLKADGSEIHEVTSKIEPEEGEEEEYEDEEEETKKRRKRESKTTQFERGEVEPVHTNGHSLVKSQINYDQVNSATAVRNQRLFWTTQIVLLTLLTKVF